MSIYSELDQIIADYVGYNEEEIGDSRQSYIEYDCADPIMYDNITEELSRYIERAFPQEYLSKEARWCLNEWESQMNNQKAYAERTTSKCQ